MGVAAVAVENGLAVSATGSDEFASGERENDVDEEGTAAAESAETAPVEDIENGAASSRGFVGPLCAFKLPEARNTTPKRKRICRIA